MIRAAIAVADLIDRITILELKEERIADKAARANVSRELAELRAVYPNDIAMSGEVRVLRAELKEINRRIWDQMDAIYSHIENRAVHPKDVEDLFDEQKCRSQIKRQINELTGSEIMEEKDYG